MSAIGADTIQREGIKNLTDVNGTVPGLYVASPTQNQQQASIRGIGNNDPGTFAAVGYYLDDVYLGRTFGRGAISYPDIERIEVLRGPQGTLYGQSTSAGAIKFVSRNPSFTDPYNWASVSLGNFGARESQIYLSSPIVRDKLSAGLAYSHRATNGDHYNAHRNTWVNRVFLDQIRGKLRWAATDKLEAILTLDGQFDTSDNVYGSPTAARPRTVYFQEDTQLRRLDFGQTLVLIYDITEHLELKSISAHRRDRTKPAPWDMDGYPERINGWVQQFREEIFSQELQLNGTIGNLVFTAGANAYHEKFDFGRHQWINENYTDWIASVGYKNYAGYAQATYHIIPQIGVTVGARYGWEKQSFDSESYLSDASQAHLSENYAVHGLTDTQKPFTPKFGADFQFTEDVFGYVSYTFGQKSGGYNRAAGTREVAEFAVAPEKVRTAEVGLKTQAFDKRLTVNVAGFHNKFEDYQAWILNPIIDGRIINGNVVLNAGKATLYGAEIETSARIAGLLQLHANATILRTRFDEFLNPTGAEETDFTGNELPHASRFQGSAGFVLTLPPFGVPGSFQLNGTASYTQAPYIEINNNPASRGTNRTWVVAGIDYFSPDEHWTLSFICKNLLDKDYTLGKNLVPSLGIDSTYYMPPRTILATVRYEL